MADYFKNCDHLEYNYKPKTARGVNYSVVQDLAVEPINVDEVKKHLRIDFNVDDTLIEMYIKAARIWLEEYTQKSFGVKTILLTAFSLPDGYKIMYGPVDTADYDLFHGKLREGGEELEIEYTTTDYYFDNDLIRNAIAMEAASRYMIRESIPINDNGNSPGQLTNLAKELVAPYREIIL